METAELRLAVPDLPYRKHENHENYYLCERRKDQKNKQIKHRIIPLRQITTNLKRRKK
jgi:hypothetical protein